MRYCRYRQGALTLISNSHEMGQEDTGDTIPGNPTLDVLRAFLSETTIMRYRLRSFLTARTKDLAQPTYYTTSEIEAYGEGTYSALLYATLDHMGHANANTDHAASHLGKAQAIVSFLRGALPLTLQSIDSGIPVSLLGREGISQEQVLRDRAVWSSSPMRNVIHSLADTSWSHLTQAERLTETASLDPGTFAVFLPAALVRRYLLRLQRVDFNLSSKDLYRTDRWLGLRLSWTIYRRRLN